MATQPRTFGLPPLRTILAISKKEFGDHKGHLLVVHLDCGHKVEHLSNGAWKVGKRTRCEDCR
jgi:hypothetical protein